MINISKTTTLKVSMDDFLSVLIDFESYPQFLEEVKEIKIEKDLAEYWIVRFKLKLVKNISYTLKIFKPLKGRISWELISSDFFDCHTGFWQLCEVGNGEIDVTYSLETSFKKFIPEKLLQKVGDLNIPNLINHCYRRAIGGKGSVT